MRTCICALFASALLPGGPVMAQAWKLTSDVNLTLTQNAYSDNWAGGETGSMSWTLNSNTAAEKQVLARVFNKNTLKVAYGITYAQDPDTRSWGSGEKSTDLIDLESTFRWTSKTFVQPIVAFRAITQFRDESVATNKRWFNPLDLTESIGIAKVFIKDDQREWQTRVGVAAKQIIDRDVQTPTGVETMTQTDGGFELVNDVKLPLAEEKIIWTSKLTVFQGVLSSASDDLEGTPEENFWRYPDINFENIFSSQITKLLAVNLYVQVLYDRQIDRDARLKQTLSLGFTYKLM